MQWLCLVRFRAVLSADSRSWDIRRRQAAAIRGRRRGVVGCGVELGVAHGPASRRYWAAHTAPPALSLFVPVATRPRLETTALERAPDDAQRKREVVPVTVSVELSCRKDRLCIHSLREMLAVPASESPEIEEKLGILGEEQLLAIATYFFEVTSQTKRDARIDVRRRPLADNEPNQVPHYNQHRKREIDANGRSLEVNASRSSDHSWITEHSIYLVECLGMNLRIGIDKCEDLASSHARSAISCRTDDALFDRDNETAAIGGNLSGCVGRAIVSDDDLDGIGTTAIPFACSIDGVEKTREVVLLIKGRNDNRKASQTGLHVASLSAMLCGGRTPHAWPRSALPEVLQPEPTNAGASAAAKS